MGCGRLCGVVSACVAAWGGFCLGSEVGWMSSVQPKLLTGEFGYTLEKKHMPWCAAVMALGAAVACLPVACMINKLSRKFSMVLCVVPIIMGWTLLTFGHNIPLALIGRFFLGVGGGSFCVSATVYTVEIAELKYRGMYGSMFSVMFSLGIFYGFLIGAVAPADKFMALFMAIPCIPFFFLLLFVPFSPVFLLSKDKVEKAQEELQRLRGKNYDISEEFKALTEEVQRAKQRDQHICAKLCTGIPSKALFISMTLLIAQQLGGFTAFMFNSTMIFNEAKGPLEDRWTEVLFGGVLFVSALLNTVFLVDRIGRRILLMLSATLQAVSCFVVAFYFLFKEMGKDVKNISWLPVMFIIVYSAAFSMGLGPIPWLFLGELFECDVRAFAAGISAFANWLSAFTVSRGFVPLKEAAGNSTPFFIFASFNILCLIFIIFVVPETKQRTIAEIQQILETKPISCGM